MGTRGIMGFRVDGEDYLQYNQYDCYPDGLGQEMVTALGELELYWIREKARALKKVGDSDAPLPTEEEKAALRKYSDLGVSSQSEDDWYCLLRACQGELKRTLESGYVLHSETFLLDSLFCEWAYIINLDDGKFEVYEGFQKNPHSRGRYASPRPNEEGYFPVALVRSFPLEDIPNDWVTWVTGEEEDVI